MKITDIQSFHCSDGVRNSIFLQVHTDEGIVGVGEPYTIGPDDGILGLVDSIKPWFIGQDPSRIAWLLRRARNTMRFPLGPVGWSALSPYRPMFVEEPVRPEHFPILRPAA